MQLYIFSATAEATYTMTAANGPLADDKALNAKDDNTRPASPLASSAKELEGAHNTDDGTTETKDAEPVYLRSLKLWLVAFALCVAIFLLTLASSKPLKNGSLRMVQNCARLTIGKTFRTAP